MKKLLLIFSVLIFGLTFSQENQKDSSAMSGRAPEFQEGGVQNFRQLIAKNFRAKKVKGKGKESCVLKFVVETDGSITNVTAIGDNESLNKEAIRAISLIKTKWSPAKINGVPVRYRFRVPLNIVFE